MAGANRLQLDFKLATTDERAAFLNEYLQRPEFIKKPPTNDELETMGNYLLWGKDPVTGLNAKQQGLDIETKHGTWDKNNAVESLEGLMESPTFNEASLMSLDSVPMKPKREVFSRSEAIAKCPEYLLDTLRALFQRIDEIDLAINYYELAHNRRTKPPREQLLARFTEEEQLVLQEKASHWNQYKYLKMRHELVELRREQYTLRDSFVTTILPEPTTTPCMVPDDPQIDCEISVLPLGVKGGSTSIRGYIFRKWEELIPANFDEEILQQVSDYYWEKKNFKPGAYQHYIDFRDLEHVYQMFQQFFELEDAADAAEMESNLPALMETLKFYIEQAGLSELHREILDLKLKKVKNVDIALEINKKWKKSYTPNYISTIFRQRIIPKINEAAAYHEKLISNIFFEEEFKTCTCCGRTLLRDTDNFTRKARSKDGFTARCKTCEKEARTGRAKGDEN